MKKPILKKHKSPSISKIAGNYKIAMDWGYIMEGWLLKPTGLYDTIEPSIDEFFEEDGDWEWKLQKTGSHKGWHFRSVRY